MYIQWRFKIILSKISRFVIFSYQKHLFCPSHTRIFLMIKNQCFETFVSILILLTFNVGFSQNYDVSDYQKINETNGGFTGTLNDYDSWGIAIDNIGDLDGNGTNDLAVGAYTDDDGGFNRGAVWILFLDANNQVINNTKISDTSGNFTGVLDNDDRFGGSVSYLGDLNSDGLIELAVGADYDGDGGYWHGAVWILSLNNDGTVNSHVKISDTQGGFNGFINGDAIFGTDMEVIGDLNNDGITDLAVGSRRDADGGSRRGAVWILFMNADLTVNTSQKISDTQGGFTPPLDFEDYFGGSVLNIGDHDGDGVTDIITGAYRDDDQLTNSGSFYILYLNTDGTVKSSQKVSNTSGGLSHQISGNALFGESIDGINDIDNDGRKEILVGALGHFNPTFSSQTGGFYMIELNDNGTVSEDYFYSYGEHCFSGLLNGGDYFGGAITLLNGGENPKIAVSAYHDSENGPERGAVWILDLGEVTYSLDNSTDPSGCNSYDGSFTISDLNPQRDYTVTYDYQGNTISDYYLSDVNGMIQVVNLAAGTYDNIVVTESIISCSDDLGSIILNGSELVDAQLDITEPSGCGISDGAILIHNLTPAEAYTISFETQSTSVSEDLIADSSGEIFLNGLSGGSYQSFSVGEVGGICPNNFGTVSLNNPNFQFQVAVNSPSACNIPDGSIQIMGLSPNTPYDISYHFNNEVMTDGHTSNGMGEILLTTLQGGGYEDLTVSTIDESCFFSVPYVELLCIEDSNLCFRAKNFFTPNGDGINDQWFLESENDCEYFTKIFDRYGKLIAVLTPENPTWDGRYMGKLMPADDYWYSVEYTSGSDSTIYRFHFTLKR